MSLPQIPNITPTISLSRADVVNLLLASIALEELGLAHIVNSEAEKIQAVIGTLPGISIPDIDIAALLAVNRSVREVIKTVAKKEMLLEFKLEEVIRLLSTSSTTTSSSTSTTTTSTSTSTSTSTTTSSTSTSTATQTTTTATTTAQPLFVFGNIASAAGSAQASVVVTAVDDAFYHSTAAPVIAGYSLTETPIIGVPTLPRPSIQVAKEVSVTQGQSWEDANVPDGPALSVGSKPWFRITVSNNGNVPLSNVTVTDPSVGLASLLPTLVDGAGVQWLAIPV